jgi:putative transcriptional regulator
MKNNIKYLRAKLDLTQNDLAEKVGCTRQTINAIEKDKYAPSLLLGFKIANVLQEDINNVFLHEKEKE